jgi:hypothetical protein
MTAIEREHWLMDAMNVKAAEHKDDKWGAMFVRRAEIHRWKLAKLTRGGRVFTG